MYSAVKLDADWVRSTDIFDMWEFKGPHASDTSFARMADSELHWPMVLDTFQSSGVIDAASCDISSRHHKKRLVSVRAHERPEDMLFQEISLFDSWPTWRHERSNYLQCPWFRRGTNDMLHRSLGHELLI